MRQTHSCAVNYSYRPSYYKYFYINYLRILSQAPTFLPDPAALDGILADTRRTRPRTIGIRCNGFVKDDYQYVKFVLVMYLREEYKGKS
jgi:hypothetical protein